jgi:hypothetical protein
VPAVLLNVVKFVAGEVVRLNAKPVEPSVVAVRLRVAPLRIVLALFTATLGVAPLPQTQLLVFPLPTFVIALNRFVATVVAISPLTERMLHAVDPDGVLIGTVLLNVYTMLPIVTVELLAGIVEDAVMVAVSLVGAVAVRVSVEGPFVIVMVLPAATPLELIVVLCDAAVPGLAVKTVPFTVTVPVSEVVEAVNVPVSCAPVPELPARLVL